jgi:hypothetical protein
MLEYPTNDDVDTFSYVEQHHARERNPLITQAAYWITTPTGYYTSYLPPK